jgi:hypothetical protein
MFKTLWTYKEKNKEVQHPPPPTQPSHAHVLGLEQSSVCGFKLTIWLYIVIIRNDCAQLHYLQNLINFRVPAFKANYEPV